MPVVHAAYLLCTNVSPYTRFALETRVLAGESPEAIAYKSAVAASVVYAFEALHYDVRPYLEHADHVMAMIQGGDGPDADDQRFCKILAYKGGPLVADALLQGSAPIERPSNPKQVAAFLAKDRRAMRNHILTMATRAMSYRDSRLAAKVMNSAEAEDDADSTDAVTALMHEIGKNFRRATPGENHLFGCVELRAADLMQVGMGVVPPHLAALKDQEFPLADPPSSAIPSPPG